MPTYGALNKERHLVDYSFKAKLRHRNDIMNPRRTGTPNENYNMFHNEFSSNESNSVEIDLAQFLEFRQSPSVLKDQKFIYNKKPNLSPVRERNEYGKDQHEDVVDDGGMLSGNDLSETSDVIQELMMLAHSESEMSFPYSSGKNGAIPLSPMTATKGIVSSRLKAIVDNWKNDESFAMSSNDPWTLKKEKEKNANRNNAVALSKVSASTSSFKDDSESDYYYSQLPIRQRLRESWRANELKNRYIRKVKPSSPELVEEKIPAQRSKSNHLLPHPDDLVLMSKGNNSELD